MSSPTALWPSGPQVSLALHAPASCCDTVREAR